MLAIAGGHVGVLLRCLQLFGVDPPPELPVVAWSAGAMALTDRVVLYNDNGPQGVQGAEVWDRGVGRVHDVVAMPHARRRLQLDDPMHAQVFVRRFAAGRCLLLDDGAQVDIGTDGKVPDGARVLSETDGRHRAVACMTPRRPQARDQPAAGARRSTTRRSTGSSTGTAHRSRGLARDVPVARRGRRGRRCGTGWSASPTRCGCAGCTDTDLWYVTTDIPEGSRIEYQFEVTRDGHTDSFLNDPLNPKLAHGPFGASSVCAATGYDVPDWTPPRPGGPAGRDRRAHASPARRCAARCTSTSTCPRASAGVIRYPLLVVHDGLDYLNYASAKTVLDNLIHRNEVAEMVVAFVPPVRPAGRVRQQRPARAVHRPRAGAGPDRRAAAGRQPGRPHPDGLELRRASRRCRPPRATPACSARCCWSRRRWCSPTSARTTAVGRSSTRW